MADQNAADQNAADGELGPDLRRQLEQELADLRSQRQYIAGTLGTDDPRGDNADQADTVERASQLTWIDDRITEITDILDHGLGAGRTAVGARDRVAVGNHVTLEFSDGSRDALLIGDIALDTGQATLLTPDSPLGRSVVGLRVGETVTYQAPSGPEQVTVIEIKPG
jgi:transcription elongation factor GreA